MKTSQAVESVNELISTLVPEKTRNLEDALSKPDLDICSRKAKLNADQLEYMRSNGLVQTIDSEGFKQTIANDLESQRADYKKCERISKILKKDLFKRKLMFVFPYLFGSDSYRDYKRAELGVAKGDLEEYLKKMTEIEGNFMKARSFALTKEGVYAMPTDFCKEVYDVFYPTLDLQKRTGPLYDSDFSTIKNNWQKLGKTSQDKFEALNSINLVSAKKNTSASNIICTYSQLVDAINGKANDGLIWTASGWLGGHYGCWKADLALALETLYRVGSFPSNYSINYEPPKLQTGFVYMDNGIYDPGKERQPFEAEHLTPGKLEVVPR